jgi:hypothetical protein
MRGVCHRAVFGGLLKEAVLFWRGHGESKTGEFDGVAFREWFVDTRYLSMQWDSGGELLRGCRCSHLLERRDAGGFAIQNEQQDSRHVETVQQ